MGCESSAETMSKKKIVLSYFDLYGRAEPIRMLLSHAKVDFVDDRVANEAWPALKAGKFAAAGSMPVLTLNNGKMLNQTFPILRLLARQYGYYPTNVEVQLEHDWVCDEYADCFPKIADAIFFEKDPTKKAEKGDELFSKLLPGFLEKIKKYLNSPGKFLFGDALTLADFVVGKMYTDYFNNPNSPAGPEFKAVLAQCPEFDAYGKRFSMEMAAYLEKRPKCPL